MVIPFAMRCAAHAYIVGKEHMRSRLVHSMTTLHGVALHPVLWHVRRKWLLGDW